MPKFQIRESGTSVIMSGDYDLTSADLWLPQRTDLPPNLPSGSITVILTAATGSLYIKGSGEAWDQFLLTPYAP
jgi:hypothetical protein